MIGRTIDNPAAFLKELGHLHDATILGVTYDAAAATLDIAIEDLNWNFEGLSGYVARPASLLFSDISAFSITAGHDKFHTTILSEGAWISEAYAITKDGNSRIDFVMSTSERWHVEFKRLIVLDRKTS